MARISIADITFGPCASTGNTRTVVVRIHNPFPSSVSYTLRPLYDGHDYASGTTESHTIGPVTYKSHTLTFQADGTLRGVLVRNNSDIKQAPMIRQFTVSQCQCPSFSMDVELMECSRATNGEVSQIVKWWITNRTGSTLDLHFDTGQGQPNGTISVGGGQTRTMLISYVPGNYTLKMWQQINEGYRCSTQLALNLLDCTCAGVVGLLERVGDCQPDGTRQVRFAMYNPTQTPLTVVWQFDKDNPSTLETTGHGVNPGEMNTVTATYIGGKTYTALMRVHNGSCNPQEVKVVVPACEVTTVVDCDKLIPGSDVLECVGGTPQVRLSVLNTAAQTVSAKWDFYGNGSQFSPTFTIPANGISEMVQGYAPGNYTPTLVAGDCRKPIYLSVPTGLCVGACTDPVILSVLVEADAECQGNSRRVTLKPVLQNPAAVTLFHWTINNTQEIEVTPGQPGASNDGSITVSLSAPGSGVSAHSVNLVAFAGECFTSHTETITVQGCGGNCPELGNISVTPGDCNDQGQRRITLGIPVTGAAPNGLNWTLTDAGGNTIPIADTDDTVVLDLAPGSYSVAVAMPNIAGCNVSPVNRQFSVASCGGTQTEEESNKCGAGLVVAAVASLVTGIVTLALQNCFGPSASSGLAAAGWILVGAYGLLMLIWALVSLFSSCELDWCKAVQIHVTGLLILLTVLSILRRLGCYWPGTETVKDVFLWITVGGMAACKLDIPTLIRNEMNRSRPERRRGK